MGLSVKSIILSTVLYGCEDWSLILMEEQILRVSESRVLRRICGLVREKGSEVCRNILIRSFTKYI
jgi:hypothetical protein